MPNNARSNQDEWVAALKATIKDVCGSAWRVTPQSGKCKLDIRMSDGSRKYKTLPIPWDRYHARRIQETVEAIFGNVERGMAIDDAIASVPLSDKQKVINVSDPKLLLDAWAKFEEYKVKIDGLQQENWNIEYGGEKNRSIEPPRTKPTGKTYLVLKRFAASQNPDTLFAKVAKEYEAGIRMRQIRVQHLAAFLRWATSHQSGYLLPDKWKPFAKGDSGIYVGTKSSEKAAEFEPTPPIETEDIYRLIDSIQVDHPNRRIRESARRNKFSLQLMAAFGLRPAEVRELKIRDGALWSMYVKKSGGGLGKPRELESFPPEMAEEWDLVNRFKKGESIIEPKKGMGEAFRKYLSRNKVWIELRKSTDVVPKSFRTSYSKRCHMDFGMTSKEAADFMGHREDVHIQNYSDFIKAKDKKESKRKAIEYRKRNNPHKPENN